MGNVTHVVAVRDGLANYVVDLLDVGATDASGDLVLMTSGDTPVATLVLSNPAFLASSSGTAAADTITADSSAAGGEAALFKVQDRDNGEVFRGSVTAVGGGGDIELSSTTIGSGDTVSISAFTYSAAN